MLDKKRSMVLIAITIVAIFGWGLKTILMPADMTTPSSYSSAIAIQPKSSSIEKIAREVTVRILNESAPGSGVMILQRNSYANGRNAKIYTILTCQHVVAESKKGRHRVLLPDGKIYMARLKILPKFKNLDLAIIEFESKVAYRSIELGDSQRLVPNSLVYAAGFPNYHVISSERIEQTNNWGKRAFRFTSGKVGLIAPRSLQEGYSLGYTNEVELGMSGGPVVNDRGKLVGINGRLKYPIQGINAFIFADGTKPSVEAFKKMEALSWAIPIATYQQIAEK